MMLLSEERILTYARTLSPGAWGRSLGSRQGRRRDSRDPQTIFATDSFKGSSRTFMEGRFRYPEKFRWALHYIAGSTWKKPSVQRMRELGKHHFPNTSIVNSWGKDHQWGPWMSLLQNKMWSFEVLSVGYLLITKGKGPFTRERSGDYELARSNTWNGTNVCASRFDGMGSTPPPLCKSLPQIV